MHHHGYEIHNLFLRGSGNAPYDHGPDGYDDLTLKFKTQEVVEALGDVNDGDELTLKLTGELYDGTPIEGEDVVVIKKKGKK